MSLRTAISLLLLLPGSQALAQDSSTGYPRPDDLLNLSWDPSKLKLLKGAPPEPKVAVVHLWAQHCDPCKAEHRIWQNLLTALQGDKELRLVPVYFVEELQPQEPRAGALAAPLIEDNLTHLQDESGHSKLLPGGRQVQPVTLVVDEHWSVRRAFVGPIESQRTALIETLDRLLHPEVWTVVLQSEPSGARVVGLAEERFARKTPLRVNLPRDSAVSVTLTLDGYRERRVELSPKNERSPLVKLERLPPVAPKKWQKKTSVGVGRSNNAK